MIRIAARFLSITLGHKSKAVAVDRHELWMLHRGLQCFTVDLAPISDHNRSHRVNIKFLLASSLGEIKTGPTCSSKKVIVIGSLVIPILESFGIEVPSSILSERCQTMDQFYLGNCGILVPNFLIYVFHDRTTTYHFIRCRRLPTHLCSLRRTSSFCLPLRPLRAPSIG